MAEVATTITAASIPALRFIVLEAKQATGRKARDLTGQRDQTWRNSQLPRLWGDNSAFTITAVSAVRRFSTESTYATQSDGISTKGVLEDTSPMSYGRICVKDEVTVDFEERKDLELDKLHSRGPPEFQV